jgi:hypothetical protein
VLETVIGGTVAELRSGDADDGDDDDDDDDVEEEEEGA